MTTFGLHPGDRVLAVAAHPDDETLGAGGTLARLADEGVGVHVLAVTCYELPRWGTASTPAERSGQFEAACDALGVIGRAIAWNGTEQSARIHDHVRDLVRVIEDGPELSLNALRPAALLIPAAGAFHQEHQVVHQACFAAARPGGAQRHTPRIVLGFDGPEDRAWTAAVRQRPVLVDITATADAKDKALECYTGELRAAHPRSIEAVRAFDTATAGGHGRAEAFTAYRMTW